MQEPTSDDQPAVLRRAHAVLTAAVDALVVMDAGGIVLEWNDAAAALFGFARNDAVGRPLRDLIVPPELREAHAHAVERYVRTREPRVIGRRLEMPALRADGSRFLVELTITAAVVDGDVVFTGELRDITELREMREELERSEQRLAALVAHVADIVTVVGADGAWRYSSPAGTRLLGYPEGHDPAGGLLSLLHPDDVAVATAALEEVVAGTRGPDEPVELRVRAADGTYRVLETVGDDLTRNPAVGGLVLTSHDVTERRRAEQRIARGAAYLSALVENLSDGVLLVDDVSYRVVMVNPAFVELLGYEEPAAALVGRDITSIRASVRDVVADSDAFFARVADLYRARERATDLVPLTDGRLLERNYIPVDIDGARYAHLWLYRDITERQRTEESLRELARLKTELVASVSHELRTPLTSLRTFIELLGADADQLSEEHRRFVDAIERNTERLLALVDDLLLLAKLEAHALQLEPGPHDLAALVRTAVSVIEPVAEAGRVSVSTDVPAGPPVLADPLRLGQLLSNLLSNAVKFTPAGGSVAVSARPEGDRWVLVVADTGIGIPEAEAGRVGDRFFRASNASGVPGTGLGLSISAAIADVHGGNLVVARRDGGGTTATVELPAVEDTGA